MISGWLLSGPSIVAVLPLVVSSSAIFTAPIETVLASFFLRFLFFIFPDSRNHCARSLQQREQLFYQGSRPTGRPSRRKPAQRFSVFIRAEIDRQIPVIFKITRAGDT